ncbi:ABC transporter substrate-binding protein [Geothermobacter ehrlichii]|uniref:ABC transporter substrate-binding protein n=1 Tax=Geothermobacter ehrlichii TaxID=213224 RepID=UPI001652ED8D|nr:penicillin-binding protein activator [Geothermobacter ehrlichii]
MSRPQTDRELFQDGLKAWEEGRQDEALQRLRGFVIRYPDSVYAPQAALLLARIFYLNDSFDEARLYFDRAAQRAGTPEFELMQGALAVADGRTAEGLGRLRTLAADDLAPRDRFLRARALARGLTDSGRALEGLLALHQVLNRGDDLPAIDRRALEGQAYDILQQLDDAVLGEAAFMFRGTALGQSARLLQARRLYAAGRSDEAQQQVRSLIADPVPFAYRRDAVLLLDRLTGKPWLQRAVGVMLPLSGRYATFGELVRRGMELAREVYGRDAVRFIYTDIAGKDVSLEVDRLANEERVMALAGPITGGRAMEAARQAQYQQVPILSLAQREGIPELGDYVFRDSLTSRLQARTLARYAVQERGWTAFGILRPQSRLGEEFARVFSEEVAALGGLVIDEEAYSPDATDFRRQIRLLMGEDPEAPDDPGPLSEEEQLEDLFVPDFPPVDFDALFIPDYADKVELIAPQLPFYGIEGVPLLGINGWNDPDLLRHAGRYVEGAIFPDGFFRYSSYPFVQDFVRRYFERYGEEPSILEAQGFDVAGILLSIFDRPDIRTREDVRLALSQLRNYPGVTGATSFDFNGEADKLLFLLQIQKSRIVQIN